MNSIDHLIEPLKHSPRLPEVVTVLQEQMERERQRRNEFYRDMSPEQKIEFIDGEAVLHSPARKVHLDATKCALKLLDTYVSIHQLGTVHSEKCLCVFPRNDYEPDIVFFGNEKTKNLTPETVKFPIPDLAVEVLSASTESRDRGVKFEDFAANEVCEYWIVNADDACIEQYVQRGEDYELVLKSKTGQLVSVVVEGFTLDIEAIFDDQKNLAALREMILASS